MGLCIDLHCDLPFDFVQRHEKGERRVFARYHLERFRAGGVNCLVAPIYVEPYYKPEKALRRGLEILDVILEEIATTPALVKIEKIDDFDCLNDPEKIGLVLAVEGGELIEDSLSLLDIYHRLGVRCFGLVHGEPNLLADAGSFLHSKKGIFDFGRVVIEELEKKGLMIDAAHLPSVGLEQLLQLTTKPFLISHTLPGQVLGENVGLSESQIRKLAERGCLLGITAGNIRQRKERRGPMPSVHEYIKCLTHLKNLTTSVDCIGLGFDFYHFLTPDFLSRRYPESVFETVAGLSGPQDVKNLLLLLGKAGYTRPEIEQIKGGNFLNLVRKTWGGPANEKI